MPEDYVVICYGIEVDWEIEDRYVRTIEYAPGLFVLAVEGSIKTGVYADATRANCVINPFWDGMLEKRCKENGIKFKQDRPVNTHPGWYILLVKGA